MSCRLLYRQFTIDCADNTFGSVDEGWGVALILIVLAFFFISVFDSIVILEMKESSVGL